ncbi:MAG: hypothetical protein CMO55_01490 [Verrucomicrobiales bacterium]|nr:hypothetical protein [Verrucomicrobiales bacterium]
MRSSLNRLRKLKGNGCPMNVQLAQLRSSIFSLAVGLLLISCTENPLKSKGLRVREEYGQSDSFSIIELSLGKESSLFVTGSLLEIHYEDRTQDGEPEVVISNAGSKKEIVITIKDEKLLVLKNTGISVGAP